MILKCILAIIKTLKCSGVVGAAAVRQAPEETAGLDEVMKTTYLNKKSPIPVYYQLYNILLEKMKNKEYEEGALIPSERELSEMYGISRMTVRQALNQLAADGLLTREKGRGTFVSGTKIEHRDIRSFSETVRAMGMEPITRVLSFKTDGKDQVIRDMLFLPEDQTYYTLKRIRSADQHPVAIEEVFIPESICPGLERQDLTKSLYALIKEEYGLAITYMDSKIEAAVPPSEERKLLGIGTGTPVLRISGLSFTSPGQVFSYERSIYRSDQFAYHARIYLSDQSK